MINDFFIYIQDHFVCVLIKFYSLVVQRRNLISQWISWWSFSTMNKEIHDLMKSFSPTAQVKRLKLLLTSMSQTEILLRRVSLLVKRCMATKLKNITIKLQYPGWIEIWGCWFLWRTEELEKNPWSKVRTNNKLNQQMALGWIQTQATLFSSKCSPHCTIPAPQTVHKIKVACG